MAPGPVPEFIGDERGAGGGAACLHGDDFVIVENEGRQMIKQLVGRPGIKVLTRDQSDMVTFSPILYWLHAQSQTQYKFLTIVTASGHTFSLTDDHLTYMLNCDGNVTRTVFARRLQPGKCVMVQYGERFVKSKVTLAGVQFKNNLTLKNFIFLFENFKPWRNVVRVSPLSPPILDSWISKKSFFFKKRRINVRNGRKIKAKYEKTDL